MNTQMQTGGAWAAAGYMFHGGFPTPETVEKAYDDADLDRAIQAYRFFFPTVSGAAILKGNAEVGVVNNKVFGVLDSKPRHVGFTLNSDTPYAPVLLDLSEGPFVIEFPPGPLMAAALDVNQRWVADMGLPGPDEGKGGKHLLLPPDYEGTVPDGYHVWKSTTNRLIVGVRSLPLEGDLQTAFERIRTIRVHPLNLPAGWTDPQWPDLTPMPQDTTPVKWEDNITYWEVLHDVIEHEPPFEAYRSYYGELAALGIVKGKPFKPDARMRAILEQAAQMGHAQMCVQAFADRRPDRVVWTDRKWEWVGLRPENGDFDADSYVDVDAREVWFYQAIGASPAMFRRSAGAGSLYWLGLHDQSGAYLDGGKTYKLTVPLPVPGKLFWSVTVYDAETRSQIQTDQGKAALRSLFELKDASGAAAKLYFGPAAPAGREEQWIKTIPGKGWFVYFRIYGPEQPAFDGRWKPGDFEEVKNAEDLITAPAMPADFSAAELAGRTVHRRAVEAVIWGMPAVNYDLMFQAAVRGARGDFNQVVYWSRLPDWKIQTLTPNPDVIYFSPFINTKDVGPMVLEIPPADEGSITGTIMDLWQSPLEDVGPAGVDKGQGGKYLILPPGYKDNAPADYIPLPSSTYEGYALLRSIPKSGSEADVAKAVAYGKRITLYPLSQAANDAGPPATTFVDVVDVVYDSTIPYDLRFFESLNRIVQAESWLERDKAMIDPLKSIGIEKGKPFNPAPRTQDVLNGAAREAQAWLTARYEASFSSPYYDDTHWALPVSHELLEGQQTLFAKPDSYSIDERGVAYSFAYFCPKHTGAGSFYLLTIMDKDGRLLDGGASYHLAVPPNVPVTQYWSATVYDRATHAPIRNARWPSRSSNTPGLQKNADGSVDIWFAPEAPAGKESNWIPTNADGGFEVLFRFYGPEKPLFEKTWKLQDIEKVQ